MYGYVVPLKTELACRDFALYRSFYCGICKLTGKSYGQFPRFTTNYDITFLSVLLHEYTKAEYRFENKACILNPFKKKVTVVKNPLFEKIAASNIILSYCKAEDGVLDKEGFKYRVVRRMLSRPYKKAAALLPAVDKACKMWYVKLRDLERENCARPDQAADCFANMLKDTVAAILQAASEPAPQDTPEPPDDPNERQTLLNLCYNVGKFVYLADALDDVGDDFRKKRYNPFLARFGGFTDRKRFIEANREELTFLFTATVNRAIACFNDIRQSFENGGALLENILYKGLRGKCDELFASKAKLKKPRI